MMTPSLPALRPLFAAFVFLAVALANTAAFACSCRPFANAAEQAAHADTIFRGRVVTSIPDPAAPETHSITTFEVIAPLKMMPHWRPDSGTIEVRHTSTRNGPQCSIWYEAGQEVLVLASVGGDGYLRTSSCSAPRWPENEYRAALHLSPAQ